MSEIGREVILSFLAIGFAAWAGVVGWGVNRVTNQIDQMAKDMKASTKSLNDYTIATNDRLTRLEVIYDAIRVRSGDFHQLNAKGQRSAHMTEIDPNSGRPAR